MSKSSHLKKDFRSNASKLHCSMGELLESSKYLKGYRIFQEYPVNRISAYFDSGREKFDWVILDIKVIIEMHGPQHYQPVTFGGIPKEEAELNYNHQTNRDESKRRAAEEAGWIYIVFKYDEEITEQLLLSKISDFQPKYAIVNTTAAANIVPKSNYFGSKSVQNRKQYQSRVWPKRTFLKPSNKE